MLPLFNHSLRLQSNQIKRYLKEYHPFINAGDGRKMRISRVHLAGFAVAAIVVVLMCVFACMQTISASLGYEFVWGVTTSIIMIIHKLRAFVCEWAYKYGYCLFMYYILKSFISVFSPFTFWPVLFFFFTFSTILHLRVWGSERWWHRNKN